MSSQYYLGIDVGLNGGIVVIDETQKIIYKKIIPTIKSKGHTEYNVNEIVDMFERLNGSLISSCWHVILEKEHARPISGKRASFMLGFGYGLMQGILESLHISYEIVSPQDWMKELNINSKDEKGSIKYCQRMFPKEDFKATDRCTVIHDGLTDSCAMAVCCLRRNKK